MGGIIIYSGMASQLFLLSPKNSYTWGRVYEQVHTILKFVLWITATVWKSGVSLFQALFHVYVYAAVINDAAGLECESWLLVMS